MSDAFVVKLGGSLLDCPDLVPRLRAYLHSLRPASVAIVVGGGATTDAVRSLDRVHGLGEVAAHGLALRGLTLNTHALVHLLGEGRIAQTPQNLAAIWALGQFAWLDPWAMLNVLEAEYGEALLPHTWEATSDSVALVLAGRLEIANLHLLKSVGPEGPLDIGGAHPRDVVDPCFGEIHRRWPGVRVRVVPFRSP